MFKAIVRLIFFSSLIFSLNSSLFAIDKNFHIPQTDAEIEEATKVPSDQALEKQFKKVLYSQTKRPGPYREVAEKLEKALLDNPTNAYLKIRLASMYWELSLKEKKRKKRKYARLRSQEFFEQSEALGERTGWRLTYEYLVYRGQAGIYKNANKTQQIYPFRLLNEAIKYGKNVPREEAIFLQEKLRIYHKNMRNKSEVKKIDAKIRALKSS